MSITATNKTSSPIKNFYKNNPWKSRFILSLFVLLLIVALARAALPQTIIYSATSWLKQQNIDSSIESININLLNGSISLINAQGSKNGEPLFNIGRIDIHWHWTPLTEKTVTITKLALDQLNVNIKKYNDEMIIGGVTFPLAQATKKTDEVTGKTNNNQATEQIQPWAASLGQVVFSNLDICYLQHSSSNANADVKTKFIDYCIELKEMTWKGNINYATDKKLLAANTLPVSSTGNFTLNGLVITDNKLNKKLLVSKTNTLSEVTITGLENIHIKQLKMHDLSVMQRDDKQHKDAIRFSQLTLNDIKFNNFNELLIKDIKINKPGLYLVKNNPSDWEYQQWIPSLNNTDNITDTKNNNKTDVENAIFKVAIQNITIDNADLCYLEKLSTVYYCYTSDHFSWLGDLGYSNDLNLTGNLALSGLNIRNHSIERDLLKISSVALKQLTIKAVNNISISEIKLDDLRALQRGEKQNDTTISFDKLVINRILHTPDSINIDTIKLDGLANHFSKNKNGEWEHSKWLANNINTDATDNKDETITEQPFIISLNSLAISTDNNILFTDNSTEPAMETGLQKLVFDINSLNTTKPDNDSLFKLFAQTTRHGTINLEGSARPFAEKISFDAKGKLKGFDLRAASPASKKAIGHIIKSGQLDADLTLLAKDGVLDSNLALSLFHFNIKPMSKKDAAALDEKFGMPLNQTLVLLRDKDDSIHLDIPVTGDVNNPNFDPMDAIIKATAKAATVTLITFYTPYGLVYAGGNILFDLATAMNFDPVKFKPGSADIKNENKDQLDKLAKLMSEKPQIRLTLCGLTNTADWRALFPALKEKKNARQKENKEENNEKQLSEAHSSALTQLAQKRQINIKNYLIKESAITHERLILCAPEHQIQEDAIAGVEINI